MNAIFPHRLGAVKGSRKITHMDLSPVPRHRRPVLDHIRVGRAARTLSAVFGLTVFTMGCDEENSTTPDNLRFGQLGTAQIVLETPLQFGTGTLRQEVEWSSDGPWEFTETVLYEGVEGDLDVRVLEGNVEVSAGIYAEWINQVNEVPGLRLFVEELDPFLDPTCTDLQSRLSLTIRDAARNQVASWTRCAPGPLADITPVGSGPDPAAGRVANAALLLRDYTVGVSFTSAFAGTVPFATIDRGEDSGAALNGPLLIEENAAWTTFWAEHARTQGPPPPIDFSKDVVLVGAVGERHEAGDSVEVRQILAVGGATVVVLQERVPGDFCSPAERSHVPFHIVRLPHVPLPVRFADVEVVRVSCG
jgi:hypothetical protein